MSEMLFILASVTCSVMTKAWSSSGIRFGASFLPGYSGSGSPQIRSATCKERELETKGEDPGPGYPGRDDASNIFYT